VGNPIHLDRVKTELSKLRKTSLFSYTENPKDKARRMERVVVFSKRKESAPVQNKASTQPMKVNRPEPQPEPFKFEFDAIMFAEKEKPRKEL